MRTRFDLPVIVHRRGLALPKYAFCETEVGVDPKRSKADALVAAVARKNKKRRWRVRPTGTYTPEGTREFQAMLGNPTPTGMTVDHEFYFWL